MSVMRFDPFRDYDRLVAEQIGRATWSAAKRPDGCLPARDQFLIHLDLPGVDADAIELTVEQNVLTIRAERRFEPEEGDEPVISERPQGTFTRQLLLGESLDTDRLEADYDQGVLTLRIPVAEAAKPRRVEITKSGGGQRSIVEGQAAQSPERGEWKLLRTKPGWNASRRRLRQGRCLPRRDTPLRVQDRVDSAAAPALKTAATRPLAGRRRLWRS